MQTTWELVESGDEIAIVVHGDVDIATEKPLIADVERHITTTTERVRFDLSDVQFIDSAGVRLLLRLRQRHGDRVCVSAASPPVERIFSIAGIDDLFIAGTSAPEPE